MNSTPNGAPELRIPVQATPVTRPDRTSSGPADDRGVEASGWLSKLAGSIGGPGGIGGLGGLLPRPF